MFAAELIQSYPEAKVILNNRPTADWWSSWTRNILPLKESWYIWLLAHFDWEAYQTFVLWNRMQDMLFRGDSRRNGRQIYIEHNALIRGMMVERWGDLLEWQPEDGWEPLCKFLGVDVPEVEFPHANQTEAFRKTVDGYFQPRLRSAGRNVKILASIVVGLVAYACWQYLPYMNGEHE